jgi:hypothetical protein
VYNQRDYSAYLYNCTVGTVLESIVVWNATLLARLSEVNVIVTIESSVLLLLWIIQALVNVLGWWYSCRVQMSMHTMISVVLNSCTVLWYSTSMTSHVSELKWLNIGLEQLCSQWVEKSVVENSAKRYYFVKETEYSPYLFTTKKVMLDFFRVYSTPSSRRISIPLSTSSTTSCRSSNTKTTTV